MDSPIDAPRGVELRKRNRERLAGIVGEWESEIHRLEVELQDARDAAVAREETHRLDREKWDADRKRLMKYGEEKLHETIDLEGKLDSAKAKLMAREWNEPSRRGIPFKWVAFAGTLGWFLGWLMSR